MIEVQAPRSYSEYEDKFKVFLAGSIEMGTAKRWQDYVISQFNDYDVVLLNPRRDDWDSSWTQSKNNPQFREQVEWELNALERCNIPMFYFDPNTKSPITMMEFGLHHDRAVVCCSDDFWRFGNIDITCEMYNIPLFNNIDDMITCVKEKYNEWTELKPFKLPTYY